MDSRTTEFAEEIRRLTNGQGVSVVLNSLNKDFIPAGLKATAEGGRFVEIGKLGVWSPAQVSAVRPDIAYSQFDLSELPPAELLDVNRAILGRIAGFLAAGEIAPPPVTCFKIANSAEAFGTLARGENVGKIVLTFGEDEDPDLALSREIRVNGTYLVTGGYGALGQRTAQWLVQAGARHVALLGRRLPSPEALAQIRAHLSGAESIELCTGNVADAAVVDRLFADAADKGRPVCGVVHLAGVIADAPILEQTWNAFRTVFLPKVAGTWNLWRAAQRGGVELFVGYSSIASVIGSISQANYAAANAFIDGLMNRYHDGKRVGLALNWGPWAGAGMAADLTDQQKKAIERKGIRPMPLQRGIEAFGRLARQAQGQLVVGEVDWGAYKASLPADDALYDAVQEATSAAPSEAFDLERLFALPTEQRKEAVLDEVISVLRRVLQYGEGDRISRRMTFAELGIDSLVAVELRNSVEKSFGLALSSSLVFDYPTVPALSAHLLDRLIQARPPAQAGADRQDPTASVPGANRARGNESVEEFA
jgi:myxalamid-type polyketide synthase MxaB